MDIVDAFIIIGVAAFIHASFQLSVSVLTLLSGHAIGQRRSHAKLLRLITGYLSGVATMTLLGISFISLVLLSTVGSSAPDAAPLWIATCGLLIGLGIAVWLFYYRQGKGTVIWLPRELSRYLTNRTKATRQSAEAFGLGLGSVAAELLFIFAPMLVSGLVLVTLPPFWQLVGLASYTIISMSPLLVVASLVGAGRSLSHIQRWREDNKSFLQFAGGAGLMVLGLYLYVDQLAVAVPVIAYGSL